MDEISGHDNRRGGRLLRPIAGRAWRPLCGAAVAALLLACAQLAPQRPSFDAWRATHEAQVAGLEAHLATLELSGIVPLHELLRSASDWSVCRDEPYAVPPATQWESLASVLRLVRALRAAGIIDAIEVHSGYRNPTLNACAGGAARSAHLVSFALDFTPLGRGDPTPQLCEFWRTQGRGWQMGLSRYPSGRIHVDTAGYRTWGADHTGKSTACTAA